MTDTMLTSAEVFMGAWQPLPNWVWRRLIERYSLSFAFSLRGWEVS